MRQHNNPRIGQRENGFEGSCEVTTWACGCEEFPLRKGGSA